MDASYILKPADLIMVRGHLSSLVDDAIKLGEHIEDGTPFATNYTHCAIYIGDSQVAEAQGGRQSGIAPLTEYAGNYDVGAVNLTDDEREAIVKEAQSQFGRTYDWLLIGALGIDLLTGKTIPFHEQNARICSTYVCDVFKNATGITLTDKDPPTPEDIALSEHVTIHKL